jgi:hypothetical protein
MPTLLRTVTSCYRAAPSRSKTATANGVIIRTTTSTVITATRTDS